MTAGWHLYVLRCADGTLYTGIALDVEARFKAHREGRGARYTKGRGPLQLVSRQPIGSRAEALKAELRFKALTRSEKLRRIEAAQLGPLASGSADRRPAVLDLSHLITEAMPVYPGCIPPTIRLAHAIEPDGFAERQISIYTHTGTHIDAPAHMLAGGATLEQLGAAHFVGPACVLEVGGAAAIETTLLEAHAQLIEGCDFVLFDTGWASRWGQPGYFEGFPVLTREAAHWLAQKGLKGVGFDAISADPVGAAEFTNHMILFRAGMISIENLTGLEPLIGKRFQFSCLPLKLEAADGCPVRAVAIL